VAPRSLSVRGEFIPDDAHVFLGFVDGDFEDLVRKVRLPIEFFDDKSEKKSLEVKVDSSRSIDADEAGILAVPGDEDPILVEQDLLQVPVLPARLAYPDHMRRLVMATFARHQRRFGAEAPFDEELGH
jgi:hypothetical protein